MPRLVYITYLPSFYKINLFNRLAEVQSLLVVFTHDYDIQREADFYNGEKKFDYISVSQYSLIGKFAAIIKLLKREKQYKLVLAGWDQPLLWLLAYYSPKFKNSIAIESSVNESAISGFKGLLKKLFLRRVAKAYVSGESQKELVNALGFRGQVIKTKGVGVFNIRPQPQFVAKDSVKYFIFVGRLSPEKNLKFLIQIFSHFPGLTLNIVGYGPQEALLKSIAGSNVVFHGAVPNSELYMLYRQNDVFILPSLSEPWGLVVEEALNNGLPVIVSDKVGCVGEIVNDTNGIVFNLSESNSLDKSILKIQDIDLFNTLRQNISQLDFEEIAESQVNCYLNGNSKDSASD